MRIKLAVIYIFFFLLSGCSGVGNIASSLIERSSALVGMGPNDVESIGMFVTSEAPHHATVAEIVFAYSDASVAVVSGSTFDQWFSNREGYCFAYGNQMDVIRIELPRGYSAAVSDLPDGHNLAKVIQVFVQNVGQYDITKLKTPWITVLDKKLNVEPVPNALLIKSGSRETTRGIMQPC